MNKLSSQLRHRNLPTKFHHDLRKITPGRALTALVGQNYQLAHLVFV